MEESCQATWGGQDPEQTARAIQLTGLDFRQTLSCIYVVPDLSGLCQAEEAYTYMQSTYAQNASGKHDACGCSQHPWPIFQVSKSNQYIRVSGDYSHIVDGDAGSRKRN